MGFKIVHLLYN